jgi:fungal STAND N-terminal Goodbye domain
MSDQSASSHLQDLFEAALNDYEMKTGIALEKHPLAEELQGCDSIESVTAVLSRQTQAFNEFREKDRILKSLKNTLSGLNKLSVAAKFFSQNVFVRR